MADAPHTNPHVECVSMVQRKTERQTEEINVIFILIYVVFEGVVEHSVYFMG